MLLVLVQFFTLLECFFLSDHSLLNDGVSLIPYHRRFGGTLTSRSAPGR